MTTKPETTFRYLLAARHSLVWVTSTEERRVERLLMAVALKQGYKVRYWDCATGVTDAATGQKVECDMDLAPEGIYAAIRARSDKELWILRDLSPFLQDHTVLRGLKSLARDLKEETKLDRLAAVVVLDADGNVPESLRGCCTMIDWPLPTREEAGSIVADIAKAAKIELNGERESILDAATGLPAEDISDAVHLSIIRSKAETGKREIQPIDVSDHKKLVIDREPTLTWYAPDPRGLDSIGGLDLLKAWLSERAIAFTPAAREYGLPAPRGFLAVGPPGVGKSAMAKAIPAAWGMPLLRLDLGALRGSLVGQSEANIRRALKVAEAVAPVALWIDEIEKSLAGSDSRGDGGVAADALGTILSWLQDRAGKVFVIATANNVESLPPELSRKGRFDEVFFVDLPTRRERVEVLRATLERYGKGDANLDGEAIAAATKDFSGAEIAELVPSAMFRAFADGGRPIATTDILEAAQNTVPVSTSAKERIEALRAWAKNRARPASSPEMETTAPAAEGYGRVLDMED